jgi:hypothetical protein
LKAKERFEMMARDVNVLPQQYLSDNGSPFTSHDFSKHLQAFSQVTRFAGAGAHHQNGIAERAIRTIVSLARTMMMHATIHWPDTSDTQLWPMAVQHATYLYNRMPSLESGTCPYDLFTRSRFVQSQFTDAHVWGCPTYVLDKTIADGKKPAKWIPRSHLTAYMGMSPKHAVNVPLVLNIKTGAITPQFHVVFDDWFATIASDGTDCPDFTDDMWSKLFGDATYSIDGDDDDDILDDVTTTVTNQRLAHIDRVQASMNDLDPPVPLLYETPAIPTASVPWAPMDHSMDIPLAPIHIPMVPHPDEQYEALDIDDDDVQVPLHSPIERELSPIQREPPVVAPTTPVAPDGSEWTLVTPRRQRENSRRSVTPTSTTPTPPTQVVSPVRVRTPTPSPIVETVTPPVATVSPTKKKKKVKFAPTIQRKSGRTTKPVDRLTLYADIDPTVLESRYPIEESGFERYPVPCVYNLEMETAPKMPTIGPEWPVNQTCYYLKSALCDTAPPKFSASELVSTDVFKATLGDPDTLSFDQAMANTEHVDEWRAAAAKEIGTLEQHGTWVLDKIENAKTKILPGTWVFRVKRAPDGTIIKYKARYCVRGDLQEGDRETFAPVVSWSTIRLFLVLSQFLKWETSVIDFNSAFVQATLNEPTWIHLPRGFHSMFGKTHCLKLLKSLYGLAEAPRLWYKHLFGALINKLGFKQSKLDPCLLYKDGIMLIVFVDDCGIAYDDPNKLKKFVADLRKHNFDLTEEGSFTKFLGIQFDTTKDNKIVMTQKGLIQRIIETTKLQDCNPNATPCPQVGLGSDPEGLPMKEQWSYRSVIGMMLYLTTNTRPDIAFAVSQVACFSNNPKQSHAIAVKTIVRYLAATADKGTIVTPTGCLNFELYADADFAGLYRREPNEEPSSARSRTGYVLSLGGFPVIWKSKLQTEISLSTLEAEYSSLSSGLRALIPIRELLFEATSQIALPPTIVTTISSEAFEDNQGALTLATTQRLTNRTKYFLVKFHHFWEYVKMESHNRRYIKCSKICTTKQRADFLTKGLGRFAFENNRLYLMGW